MLHLSPKTFIYFTVWIFLAQTVKADLFEIVDGKNIELGEFNDVQLLTWKLKNTSSKPLRITKVNGGCSCVESNWPRVPVNPGKEAEIHIAYDPNLVQTGKLKRYVIVNISPGNKLMSLSFTGEIKRDIDFNPISPRILLDPVRPGENWMTSIQLKILPEFEKSFKILGLTTKSGDEVNYSIIKNKLGSLKINFVSNETQKTGQIVDELLIKYSLNKKILIRKYDIRGFCGNQLVTSSRLVTAKVSNRAKPFTVTKEYLVHFPDLIDIESFKAKTSKGEKVSFKLDGKKLKVTVTIPESEVKEENTGKIDITAPGLPPQFFVYLIEK